MAANETKPDSISVSSHEIKQENETNSDPTSLQKMHGFYPEQVSVLCSRVEEIQRSIFSQNQVPGVGSKSNTSELDDSKTQPEYLSTLRVCSNYFPH